MITSGDTTSTFNVAAALLETRFEKIVAIYEDRLLAADSPLVCEKVMHEQLRSQACSVLEDTAQSLRWQQSSDTRRSEDRRSVSPSVPMIHESVHAGDLIRALVALSEVAISVVIDDLFPSPTADHEVLAVAFAIQRSIMKCAAQEIEGCTDYLLQRAHESRADERRRISRELHDRLAPSIMVAFRSLELCDLYGFSDSPRTRSKFDLAKMMMQETFESTRSLSREFRAFSPRDGLEQALSTFLSIVMHWNGRFWVFVEGDESVATSEVRDELFAILCEAIRNAATHSAAKTITVKVELDEGQVRATVEDDGQGFNLVEKSRCVASVGLASMEERTESLGGTLALTSAPDNGTKVEVCVPLPRRRH